MKEDIDDLLDGRICSKLLASYEVINLGGLTLKVVNDEYKTVTMDPNDLILKWAKLMIWSIVVTVVSIIIIGIVHRDLYYMMIPVFVIFVPVNVYCIVFVRRKVCKDKEILSRCGEILDNFRTSASGLYSYQYNHMNLTAEFMYKILVERTEDILKRQELFDEACLKGREDIDHIVNIGRHINHLRRDLDEMSGYAQSFGVYFHNRDLFTAAEKARK